MSHARGRNTLAECAGCGDELPYLSLRPQHDRPQIRVCEDCLDPVPAPPRPVRPRPRRVERPFHNPPIGVWTAKDFE